MVKRFAKDFLWSSVAGYAATLVMERSANFLYERQNQSSRQREEQLRQEMPTATLVRRAGEVVWGRRSTMSVPRDWAWRCTTRSAPAGDQSPH
jgi:hypothetical protein